MRYSQEVQENDTIALRRIESTPSETLKLPLQMMMKVGVEEEMCLLSKLLLLL